MSVLRLRPLRFRFDLAVVTSHETMFGERKTPPERGRKAISGTVELLQR